MAPGDRQCLSAVLERVTRERDAAREAAARLGARLDVAIRERDAARETVRFWLKKYAVLGVAVKRGEQEDRDGSE